MIDRGTMKPRPTIKEIGLGDVAYCLAKNAIEEKWGAEKLGPAIAALALDFANEEQTEQGVKGFTGDPRDSK